MINLSAQNLCKSYKKRKVVDKCKSRSKKMRDSGTTRTKWCWKDNYFLYDYRNSKPESGKVFCDNMEVTDYPMYKRANMGIGYLAQEPSIFRNLTVEENIAAVLEMKGISKIEQKETIDKLLEEFKLTHVQKSLGFSLSGGERRRVEIARTIANNPSFILLDEPFAGVDPIAVEDIQQIIRYLKNRGLGILITDHSVRETLRITEKAYIMAQGKVLISGTPEEIAENETARKIYLGEKFKLD